MKCIIKKILPKQTGVSAYGEWQNQEFIAQACDDVQYPDEYFLRVRGSRVGEFFEGENAFKEGDQVELEYASRVRSFETARGTAYSQENTCWKMERPTSEPTTIVDNNSNEPF